MVGAALKGRSKYKAKPTVVDNIRFASMKEARRYGELKMLERAGKIVGLELQPKFPIYAVQLDRDVVDGRMFAPSFAKVTKVGRYTADFAYIDCKTGERVIEDTKSSATATEAYRLRKRHVEAQHGIEIREV